MSDTTISPENIEDAPNERRALLRKLAIGGAGAAAGVAMLKSGTASAAPANMRTEETNSTVAPTIVDFTPTTPPTKVGPSAFSAGGYVPAADSPYAAGVGGYGDATILNGVHGSTTAPDGFGVVAANLSPASAATVQAPIAQAIASPNGVHMLLLAGAKSGPADGKHGAGELYVDKDGTLWFTVPAPTTADATAVRFVKLAGTPTTGSYHAITPQRAYDSRQPNYTVKGLMTPGTNRVISVADGHDSAGTVTLANAVPAGATAVHINVTAASMTGPNFFSVTAGNTASTETSLFNWDAGVKQIANSITVPVDSSRQIKVFLGIQAGSSDLIVDVFGYYL